MFPICAFLRQKRGEIPIKMSGKKRRNYLFGLDEAGTKLLAHSGDSVTYPQLCLELNIRKFKSGSKQRQAQISQLEEFLGLERLKDGKYQLAPTIPRTNWEIFKEKYWTEPEFTDAPRGNTLCNDCKISYETSTFAGIYLLYNESRTMGAIFGTTMSAYRHYSTKINVWRKDPNYAPLFEYPYQFEWLEILADTSISRQELHRKINGWILELSGEMTIFNDPQILKMMNRMRPIYDKVCKNFRPELQEKAFYAIERWIEKDDETTLKEVKMQQKQQIKPYL